MLSLLALATSTVLSVPPVYVIAMPARMRYMQSKMQEINASAIFVDPERPKNYVLQNSNVFISADSGVMYTSTLSPYTDRGCASSHAKAMAQFLDSGQESAIIFEDDVMFTNASAFLDEATSAINSLPPSWSYMYFGRCGATCVGEPFVSKGIVRTRDSLCTHAYAVTRRGAHAYLALNEGNATSDSDQALRYLCYTEVANCYALKTSIVFQNGSLGSVRLSEDFAIKTSPDCWDRGPYVQLLYSLATVLVLWLSCHKAPSAPVFANVCSACFLILCAKQLLNKWPYPIAATAATLTSTALSQWGYRPKVEMRYTRVHLPLAQTLGMCFVNLSLLYNDIGVYEIGKKTTLIAVWFIQLCLFRVNEGAIAVVAFTVVFAAVGVGAERAGTSFWGIVCAALAATTQAYGLVLLKWVKEVYNASSGDIIKAYMPTSAALAICISFAFEQVRFPMKPLEALLLVLMCLSAVMVNMTAVSVIGNYSPVLYLLLQPLKTMIVVTLSGSWGSVYRVIGIIGCCACAPMYRYYAKPWKLKSELLDASAEADTTVSPELKCTA